MNHRGSLRLGGGKRARDGVEEEAHPEAVTARLEGADGTAAELEGGGPIVYEKCDPGGPDTEGALIAERRAELETLAQAGAGLFGVGLDDGHADGEQAAGDERRIADLPGQRERLAGQRDRPGRVADKQVTARGEAELEGGVGEVATGSARWPAARSSRRAASANAPAVNAMFERASQMTSSTRQSWGSRRSLASAARRHSSSVTVTSARWDANMALTARASG